MQLSGLSLGKWAAWAFWPSLVLSCSGLRTQTMKFLKKQPAPQHPSWAWSQNASVGDQMELPWFASFVHILKGCKRGVVIRDTFICLGPLAQYL